jgi:hypothetical protein
MTSVEVYVQDSMRWDPKWSILNFLTGNRLRIHSLDHSGQRATTCPGLDPP